MNGEWVCLKMGVLPFQWQHGTGGMPQLAYLMEIESMMGRRNRRTWQCGIPYNKSVFYGKKTSINGGCSVALLDYQRVTGL